MAQRQYSDKNIAEHNFKKLTAEEQRRIASQGGKASVEARRQRKTLAQIGDMIGGLKLTNESKIKVMKAAGIADEDMIKDVAAMYKLASKAESGDVRAMELLSKLRGQFREVQSVEVSEVKPLVDLTKRKKNGDK
jgi:hypothetical protein